MGRGTNAEADPRFPLLYPEVHIQSSQTVESSGLYTLKSVLKARLLKEDRDARFYCELSYRLPSGNHMKESREVTVPVFCESSGQHPLLTPQPSGQLSPDSVPGP